MWLIAMDGTSVVELPSYDNSLESWSIVLGGIPEILYAMVFSSNCFRSIEFQIYRLCWHRYIEGSQHQVLELSVDGLDVTTKNTT